MREIAGSLFRCADVDAVDAVCIPTNGVVSGDGEAFMRYGTANLVSSRWPQTARRLGTQVKSSRHSVGVFSIVWTDGDRITLDAPPDDKGFVLYYLVSFPIQHKTCPRYSELLDKFRKRIDPTSSPGPYPGWMAKADTDFMRASVKELVALADKHRWTEVYLPKIGCGAGLEWEDARPIFAERLDDRFTVVDLHWDKWVRERVGVETGVVRAGDKLRVVLSPRIDVEVAVEVLACYDKNMYPTNAVNLGKLKLNETLYVAIGGKTQILNIGPGFSRNKDYVVSLGES